MVLQELLNPKSNPNPKEKRGIYSKEKGKGA